MPTWSEYFERLTRGVPPKIVASRVGVDSSQISRWKNGQAPTAENAIRLAVAFDGNPAEALIAAGHAADINNMSRLLLHHNLRDAPTPSNADGLPKHGVRHMEETWANLVIEHPDAARLVIELAVAAEELNQRSAGVFNGGKDFSLILRSLQLFVNDTSQLMSRIRSAALEVAGRDPVRLEHMMDEVRSKHPEPYLGGLSKRIEELLISVPSVGNEPTPDPVAPESSKNSEASDRQDQAAEQLFVIRMKSGHLRGQSLIMGKSNLEGAPEDVDYEILQALPPGTQMDVAADDEPVRLVIQVYNKDGTPDGPPRAVTHTYLERNVPFGTKFDVLWPTAKPPVRQLDIDQADDSPPELADAARKLRPGQQRAQAEHGEAGGEESQDPE